MIQTTPSIGTTMGVETVDPTIASKYLESAAANRHVRRGKTDQYARDMINGRWYSSVLRFDTEGKLVDGQHRLWAVVSSGTTQTFYVERGLPPEAVNTIDSGMQRTGGDVLSILGEPNAITLASAIRYANWFENFPGKAPSGQSNTPFSPEELIRYLEVNPDIHRSVRLTKQINKVVPIKSASLAAALHHVESKRNAKLADEFWEQMNTGLGMTAGTGPYMLRRQLIADSLKAAGQRMPLNTVAAMSIKAWNLFESGKIGRQLRWIKGPQQQEGFPRIGARPTQEDLDA